MPGLGLGDPPEEPRGPAPVHYQISITGKPGGLLLPAPPRGARALVLLRDEDRRRRASRAGRRRGRPRVRLGHPRPDARARPKEDARRGARHPAGETKAAARPRGERRRKRRRTPRTPRTRRGPPRPPRCRRRRPLRPPRRRPRRPPRRRSRRAAKPAAEGAVLRAGPRDEERGRARTSSPSASSPRGSARTSRRSRANPDGSACTSARSRIARRPRRSRRRSRRPTSRSGTGRSWCREPPAARPRRAIRTEPRNSTKKCAPKKSANCCRDRRPPA